MSVPASESRFKKAVGLGLLALCTLAVLVGLINGFQKDSAKSDVAVLSSSKSSKMKSLLGPKNKLRLITLSGPIYMDAPQEGSALFPSETNAVGVRKALDAAAEDKNVKGVLLRINSPGGTVAMSQELNAAVQRVSKKKPIVASLGDMAASGGYYTACAADRIITNRGTLTASIGVIISTMNFKGLMENKLGVKAVTVKSGKFKDILSPYRDARPEETALIQKLINDSYQDFLNAVITGRTHNMLATETNMKQARIESIKAVADGRVVHGEEAVRVGLADEIGDMQHAYVVLDKMAKEHFHLKGQDKLPLEDADRFSLMDLFGLGSSDAPEAKLPQMPAISAGYMQALPLSLRYPNQPLWILE